MSLDRCRGGYQGIFDLKPFHATVFAQSSMCIYFSVAGSGQVGTLSVIINQLNTSERGTQKLRGSEGAQLMLCLCQLMGIQKK